MAIDTKAIVETAARVGAGAVGVAAGLAAGAVGAAAGVAAGAAQALAGKRGADAAGKAPDANAEELYWREHFGSEPYYDRNFAFEDYLPAWRTGWEGRAKYAGRTFDDAQRELEADFHWNRGKSRLLWDQARDAVRAAFERLS